MPTGNAEPLGKPATRVIAGAEQLSLAVGAAHVATSEQNEPPVEMEISAGQNVNTGRLVSTTVTEKAQDAENPFESVATYFIEFTPIGNNEPLGDPVV